MNTIGNILGFLMLLATLFYIFVQFSVTLIIIVPLLAPLALLAAPYQIYNDVRYGSGPMKRHWSTIPYLFAHKWVIKILFNQTQKNV